MDSNASSVQYIYHYGFFSSTGESDWKRRNDTTRARIHSNSPGFRALEQTKMPRPWQWSIQIIVHRSKPLILIEED